ncbi:MAG: acyltransferase [Verrucomicrobiota bacterium JB024]|nr:acyltransferase [Verrucomicrobiota bacterium JB024]
MLKSLITRYRKQKDMVAYCRSLGMTVGERCKINPHATFGTEPYLISIGDHCEITGLVHLITHDGGVWVFREEHPEWDVVGRINIEDNVYIGYGATIMPNVRIGKNSVIAARSVVTKDIPPNSVAAGIPAKVIKTIDEYKEKCQQVAISTKHLHSEEKKKKILSLLNDPQQRQL